MEEFPVSRGALAQQLGTIAPMAAIGGIAGAATGEEVGVNPLLAGLAGAVAGGAGGSALARFAKLAPMAARRGATNPEFLTGGLAGAAGAASRFKAAAADPKFAGVFGNEDKAAVAQKTLSDILGGRRLTAPSPKEIAALPETEDFFQRLNLYTSPKLTKRDLTMLNPETRAALEADLPLDIRMLGMGERGLGAIPETLPEGGYEIGSVLKQAGMRPISVGGKNWDMTKVSPQNVLLHYARKGDLDGFAEAYSKMLNNQLSLYSERAVRSIVDATEPEFYPVARDFILSVSEATKLPPHVIGIGLAAASQNATPTKEILRLIQAAKILVMKDGKVAINAKQVMKDGKSVWVTEDGVKIPEGQFTINSAKAMVEVINNPAYANINIPGIANKTWLYNMSKFDPQNFGIYTNDSIDSYVLAASTNTPITISDFVQSLAGRSVGQGATRAQNLPGPSGQAIPWFAMRALRPDTSMIGGSFTPELLELTTENTKNLSNIDEVAEFAKSQIDDLLKNSELRSNYKMTDQGILVPDVANQPGLLVPYEARNPASMGLEASMGSFTEAIGGATRAAGTRGGKVARTMAGPKAKPTTPQYGMSLADDSSPVAKGKTSSKLTSIEKRLIDDPDSYNFMNGDPDYMDSKEIYKALHNKDSVFSKFYDRVYDINRNKLDRSYGETVNDAKRWAAESLQYKIKNILGSGVSKKHFMKVFEVFGNGEGKLYQLTGRSNPSEGYSLVARELDGMSDAQVDTFFSLIPEWEGRLQDLASVARSLAD